ncbi:MAG TPA: sugar ABC transporter permease [Falsiroseomonas sp.]|jgi:multiple sugar transport system permease protein|nr:sugar ABC transporter permease [Falsiroseomonas sp.]
MSSRGAPAASERTASSGVTEADRAAVNPLDRGYAALGILLIAPTVLIFCAVIVYPLVSAVYLSLFSIFTPTLAGNFVGLRNYAELMDSPEFWRSLLNNLTWTVLTLSLQIIFGVAAALMLNQAMVFRSLARSLILFPYFVSTVVAVLVWRWLFNDLYGVLNHAMMWTGILDMPLDWLGAMPNAMISVVLVGAWKYFPFVVIAVLARLQTIPEQLYEAATIDGAGAWGRFWDVTLPQLREVLVVVVLLRAIWDFKEFDLIYLLTGGGPIIGTQTLPLMVYKEAFGMNEMGRASAVAVAMMLVMLVFMLLYFRVLRARGEEPR